MPLTSASNRPHVQLYLCTTKKGWGAVAVHSGFRSIFWKANGVIADSGADATSPMERANLSIIGLLRRLLRPTPGLPLPHKLNAVIHIPCSKTCSLMTLLVTEDKVPDDKRDFTVLISALSKSFNVITFETEHDDDEYWAEAMEEAERVALSVKRNEKNCLEYYPNLCMTATVTVKDSRSSPNNHHNNSGKWPASALAKSSSCWIETNITHDLLISGRKGISMIDAHFAETLSPGVLSNLMDPGDFSVITGNVCMNILGIYPGTLEVRMQENANITLEGSHLQRLEGVVVVSQFPVPLFVSLDLGEVTTGLKKYCVDMGVDTFRKEYFGARYRFHRWWSSGDYCK